MTSGGLTPISFTCFNQAIHAHDGAHWSIAPSLSGSLPLLWSSFQAVRKLKGT